MRKKDIKTIDIQALEWRDRINGNSYCAVRTTLNYGMPDAVTLVSQFQYGYGDYYKQLAMETLRKQMPELKIDDRTPIWRFCDENKIILRHNIETGCLKREVIRFGNV